MKPQQTTHRAVQQGATDGELPLVIGMLRASVWFDEALRDLQQRRGFPSVSRPEAMLLGHIAAGERRAVRIARQMAVSRQAVSKLVADLVAKGIVAVEPDPADARAQLLDFSPEHASHLPELLTIFRAVERHLGRVVGEDRLAVFRQVLSMDWGEPRVPPTEP